MAKKIFNNVPIETPKGLAYCNAECFATHDGTAAFAVYGVEQKDKGLIDVHRTETSQKLHELFSEHTGRSVTELSLFVDNGGERLSGSKVEFGKDGKITRATPDPRDHISPQTFDDLGQNLHNQDWAHQQDLKQHSFNPQNRPEPTR